MQKAFVKDSGTLTFDRGILREPSPDESRIIVWLPGPRDGTIQHWQRVSTIGQPNPIEAGVWFAFGNAIHARQTIRGFIGRILQRFQRPLEQQNWSLPDGSIVQQCGERRNDLFLVWDVNPNAVVNEAWIKSRWPMQTGIQRVGPGAFVVNGVAGSFASNEVQETIQPPGCPRAEAEQMLVQARGAGDLSRETSALTDLGVMALAERDTRGAVARLEAALVLARKLGDPIKEADVLGNLGVALLKQGQMEQSQSYFETQLQCSHAAADPFGEKNALERLGILHSRRKEVSRAIRFFEKALALARATGDLHHQSTLLWELSAEHAQQGQREQAISLARLALDIKESLADPEASVFRRHLDAYRLGDAAPLVGTMGYSVAIAGTEAVPAAAPGSWAKTDEPRVLRKAFAAAKAAVKLMRTGFKAVPAEIRQNRLQTCADCSQFTGLRCRACGCFTKLKSLMPHEKCPLGKWKN